MDNGYPLATESNILQELIKPPNIIRSVVNTVTGKSKSVYLKNIEQPMLQPDCFQAVVLEMRKSVIFG